ncbi:MAG: exopolyphosphatase [Synergistaceae bacterium]|nr:exopolyphosphatase [Synergistaceae bacterium]
MRLLTRSDFDGLMCAVLLKDLGIIEDRKFVHPKDIQEGMVEVTENDILVNVPYVAGCGMWFDHHTSEEDRITPEKKSFKGSFSPEKSCARVIYNYYGGDNGSLRRFSEMVLYADKCDSADFSVDDIVSPQGWVMLSFIMDPRTGFGRYRSFRIANYQLMDELIEYLQNMSIDEIMELEDIQERVELYKSHEREFFNMIVNHSHVVDDVLITDLRGIEETFVGNRHVPYALYPETNISIRILDGKNKENIVFSVGYSVINKTAKVDVGKLMAKFNGGGHKQVGTCQVSNEDADKALDEMLSIMLEENK